MEPTGFTRLGKCPLCRKEAVCYEMETDEGYIVILCWECFNGLEGED